jgi:hypothetical protein
VGQVLRETLRNGKSEIIRYRETGSANREILRDKNNRILGRFETDTKFTRDADGRIAGRGSNNSGRAELGRQHTTIDGVDPGALTPIG